MLSFHMPAQAGHSCGTDQEPWVLVLFPEGNWRPETQQAILLDLRADLASHHIEACIGSEHGSQPPAATISLSTSGLDAVHVTVSVHDAVTRKEVSRDVDLNRVPGDGRAFAVALAADELLWASWAEIALRRPRRTIQASPRLVAEVSRTIAPGENQQRPNRRLGVRLTEEHYTLGLTQIGPDVALSFHGSPPFIARFSAGYREGLEVVSRHGRIASSAVVASVDLGTYLLRMRRFELFWSLGESSAWCRFDGKTTDESLGGRLTGLAIYAQSSLAAALRVHGPLWLELGVGGGIALRGIEAMDNGQVAAGIAGFRQSASIAIMGEL